MNYQAHVARRRDAIAYCGIGHRGLQVHSVFLGLWNSCGYATQMHTKREILPSTFDLGIAHFDPAKEYRPLGDSRELTGVDQYIDHHTISLSHRPATDRRFA